MKIRLLKKEDVVPAAKIVGINYSKKYQKRSKREIEAMFRNHAMKPQYFVAENGGKIVGFAGYIQSWMDYNIYQIYWVNVIPECQHKGVGTALVRKIISVIKKKGEARIVLLTTTRPDFYRKLGFRAIFRFRKTYLMALRLR